MIRSTIAVLMFASAIISSCKKEKDPVPPKSISELIKNKTWSGLVKYSTVSYNDPFSISFQNNIFTWSERNGDYPGVFVIVEDERKVILTFATGSKFDMIIPGETKAEKFNYGAAYNWNILNCEANPTANDILVGTKWKTGSGTAIEFISASQLKFTGSTFSYSRNGAVIKFTNGASSFFLVFNGNKMGGLMYSTSGMLTSVEFVRE
jgi:hypothetical protein